MTVGDGRDLSRSVGSIDDIPGPVLVLGRDGERLRVTEDAREVLGEALTGDAGGDDPLAPLVDRCRRCLTERAEIEDEVTVELAEDRLVLEVRARPIPKQRAALCLFTDVTPYREKLEAQRKRKRVLEEAQALAGIGSWEWDLRTGEIEWSEELYRLFGRDPATFEPTFESYLGCLHPDDVDKVRSLVCQARERGEAFTFEHRIVTPKEATRRLHCRAEIVTDAEGEPVRMVGTAQRVDRPTM